MIPFIGEILLLKLIGEGYIVLASNSETADGIPKSIIIGKDENKSYKTDFDKITKRFGVKYKFIEDYVNVREIDRKNEKEWLKRKERLELEINSEH